jgi:hypothetical protein
VIQASITLTIRTRRHAKRHAHAQKRDLDVKIHDAMPYMIVEHFKNGDAAPVYRRFRERGRMAPAGLEYVSSWDETNYARCFQVMQTDDARLLDEWMANWSDLIDFEVRQVITSKDAAEAIV